MPFPPHTKRLVVNGALLGALALIIVAVSLSWISGSQYFFYWDLAWYENTTVEKAAAFREAPLRSIYKIYQSTRNNYNHIFTIPLLPLIWAFGESRSVYILSVALVYLLPYALTLGAITTQLVPTWRYAAFWSVALLTLLSPMAWAPTLLGWPDAGAACLMALAVFVYLREPTLKSPWQIIAIGFLVAAAMLFRRPYAYASFAFFLSIGLQMLIGFVFQARESPRRSPGALASALLRIGLAVGACLVFLAVIGAPHLYNLLTRDYSVHDSYKNSTWVTLWFYVSQFGLTAWVGATVGLIAGIVTGRLNRSAAQFIFIFGAVSLALWVCEVGIVGTQHSLHFTFFVILGVASLCYIILSSIGGKWRVFISGIAITFFLANMFNSLVPTTMIRNGFMRALFAAEYRPRVTPDYSEIRRLITYLRSVARNEEPIYVVASSYALNWDLLKNAERALFGRNSAYLTILQTPEVDSRHFYPEAVEKLAQAKYVVLATPFQHHLQADEQDVVNLILTAFKGQWRIAQDFKRLSADFALAGQVRVEIFERIHPIEIATAVRTIIAARNYMEARAPTPKWPWVTITNDSKARIRKSPDNTFHVILDLDRGDKSSRIVFAYLGELTKETKVAGSVLYEEQCLPVSIRFLAFDKKARLIDSNSFLAAPGELPDFSVMLTTESAEHVVLDVHPRERVKSKTCRVDIQRLSISRN